MSNIKKQYTITPSCVDEAIFLFKKYENGKIVESYGILIDEFDSIRQQAEKDGYTYAIDISSIKHEIAVHEGCINALQMQINEFVASGDYVTGED